MLKLLFFSLIVALYYAQDVPIPDFPKGGPLSHVYKELNNNQQEELDKILEDTKGDNKKIVRQKITEFIDRIDKDEIKNRLKDDHTSFKDFKSNLMKQCEKLSPEGQELFNKLVKILENDNITFIEEHEQMKEAIDNADEKLLKEFHEKKIPLPGAQPIKGKHDAHAVVDSHKVAE